MPWRYQCTTDLSAGFRHVRAHQAGQSPPRIRGYPGSVHGIAARCRRPGPADPPGAAPTARSTRRRLFGAARSPKSRRGSRSAASSRPPRRSPPPGPAPASDASPAWRTNRAGSEPTTPNAAANAPNGPTTHRGNVPRCSAAASASRANRVLPTPAIPAGTTPAGPSEDGPTHRSDSVPQPAPSTATPRPHPRTGSPDGPAQAPRWWLHRGSPASQTSKAITSQCDGPAVLSIMRIMSRTLMGISSSFGLPSRSL